MTKPRYQEGCSAGSQVPGLASPVAGEPDYAWNVNFNNGNANWNHRDNHNHVLAVRGPSEYQGAASQEVSLRALYEAWRAARRQKSSSNQLAFEAHWLDNLIALQTELNSFTWRPRRSVCFVATRPKAREIHAPDFADRVVHHLIVPQLERIWEPTFIFDSFSNRKGKGTHAAVARLRDFAREVHSGQGGGWYLQLDIHNFFNSIHRPTLYGLLKERMARHGVPLYARHAVHSLLRGAPLAEGVIHRSTPEQRALVPPHKRLQNAASGCGLPIGNLSSQFFANVYLNELDQHVKHVLKVRRYVRYVDDFVLVHQSREQLQAWQRDIEAFLRDRLRLELKPEIKLQPINAGVDFLGYVIYPTHIRIRHRVVAHAREKLAAWGIRHASRSRIRATPEQLSKVGAIWASYAGHLRHGRTHRLTQDFRRRFPWLDAATRQRRFDYRLEGRAISIPTLREGR